MNTIPEQIISRSQVEVLSVGRGASLAFKSSPNFSSAYKNSTKHADA